MGMVPREEFDRLQKRVQALENMVTDEDLGPEC